MTAPGLIFALDVPTTQDAVALATQVKPHAAAVKIGLELFCAEGPAMIRDIREEIGVNIFLDLKLHDIGRTVCGALKSLASLSPFMLTLHAANGQDALSRAVACAAEEADKHNVPAPKLLGVTLLTALSPSDISSIGFCLPAHEQALHMAEFCMKAGMDGIVCSPLEVKDMKTRFPDLLAVTPGIRPVGGGVAGDDQSRAATPRFAAEHGSDYLVVGRPVANASDPAKAAKDIALSLESKC